MVSLPVDPGGPAGPIGPVLPFLPSRPAGPTAEHEHVTYKGVTRASVHFQPRVIQKYLLFRKCQACVHTGNVKLTSRISCSSLPTARSCRTCFARSAHQISVVTTRTHTVDLWA
jgi:hypothetical protein